jgi:hypothetical protein
VRSQRAKEWRCESVLLCASGIGKDGGWGGGGAFTRIHPRSILILNSVLSVVVFLILSPLSCTATLFGTAPIR